MAAAIVEAVVSRIISAYRPFALKFPRETEWEGGSHEDGATRDDIMKTAQMHLVVASLIMTVTFTLPGGFENDTERDGNSITKSSIPCICCFGCHRLFILLYFAMAANAILDARELKTIVKNYNMAIIFQINAMAAVVVAFATGVYEQSLGLPLLSLSSAASALWSLPLCFYVEKGLHKEPDRAFTWKKKKVTNLHPLCDKKILHFLVSNRKFKHKEEEALIEGKPTFLNAFIVENHFFLDWSNLVFILPSFWASFVMKIY